MSKITDKDLDELQSYAADLTQACEGITEGVEEYQAADETGEDRDERNELREQSWDQIKDAVEEVERVANNLKEHFEKVEARVT